MIDVIVWQELYSLFYLFYLYIMSFRWNLSQPNKSDHSFITQGNELIATSIGITGNRTALSCRMNMNQQDYKYCKTEEQALISLTIIETKLKRWAFREIQKHTHYHREYTNSVFLPQALSHGNYNALSKFLQNLRSNRVNAYVKLNLHESKGYFHKATTLINPLSKIFKHRVQQTFLKLKKNMIELRQTRKNLILEEISRFSSIQNKESINSELDEVNQNANTIKVSYVKINLSPQNIKTSSNKHSYTSREFSTTKKTSQSRGGIPCLDLSEFITPSKVRHYQFKNIPIPKVNSRRHHPPKQL